MAIVLGPNQYGKAEVRVVAVDRSTPRHTLVDLNVSSSLRGDFTAAHTAGDNAHVLTTDAQKNTVFAFARDGIGTPEQFALRLARHFAGSYDWISGARVAVESYGWDRIAVGGRPHDHAFSRNGGEVRTAVVTVDGDDVHVLAGLSDLVVLKTTGSEFWGFPRDRYTTLAETATGSWPPRSPRAGATPAPTSTSTPRTPASGRRCWRRSPRRTPSRCSSRCSRWARRCWSGAPTSPRSGCRCRTSTTSCRTCRRSAWTTPTGAVVYHADDRPYGLIEGTVLRDDVPPAEVAWQGTPGFC